MSAPTKRLLYEILSSLISEWGQLDVERALKQVTSGSTSQNRASNIANERLEARRKSPSASDYIDRIPNSFENKELITQLANRFDRKEFLPSLRDVYLFLSKRGVEGAHLKSRTESFRKVLDVLASAPKESLERMLKEGVYLGPSRLGPLSDAIRATSESMRGGSPKSDESSNDKN